MKRSNSESEDQSAGNKYRDMDEGCRGRKRCSDDENFQVGERCYGEEAVCHHPEKKQRKDNNEEVRKDDCAIDKSERVSREEKEIVDLLTSETVIACMPLAKLRMMQAEITDKSGAVYQRIAWEALKKSIHDCVNNVNTGNISVITIELLKENIVRGRGLLARSIIHAQAASPTFTPVYAALSSVINSKFPNIGDLIVKRLVMQFKIGFRRNDKPLCISSATFIAHLVNQGVVHDLLALQILTFLIETPTDDSIEVAIALLKECGMKLTEVCHKSVATIFEMLRMILNEGQLDKRVRHMIKVIFRIGKDGFKDFEAVSEELDLVEEEKQFTHSVMLDEVVDSLDFLNAFEFDNNYLANEEMYKEFCNQILESDTETGSEDEESDEDESSDEEDENQTDGEEDVSIDDTEKNLTPLQRTIYSTIHSSSDLEDCVQKFMRMQLKPGEEVKLCHAFLDYCAEMLSYEKFFGMLAERFCTVNKTYVTAFEEMFKDSYQNIHCLGTNKLRNVAKFFAHLLFTDSISWQVFSCIKLNEEDTTSSGRIFIEVLLQVLSKYMGPSKLNERIKDDTLQEAFDGLFPRDDPKNTHFAINFFRSIGLDGLADHLREHLTRSLLKLTVVIRHLTLPVQ